MYLVAATVAATDVMASVVKVMDLWNRDKARVRERGGREICENHITPLIL